MFDGTKRERRTRRGEPSLGGCPAIASGGQARLGPEAWFSSKKWTWEPKEVAVETVSDYSKCGGRVICYFSTFLFLLLRACMETREWTADAAASASDVQHCLGAVGKRIRSSAQKTASR
ncbi:unnamed protein product [Calypogeia fissa]